MPLDPKQERYLARFFPGLVAAIEGLVPGEQVDFEPRPIPKIKTAGSGIRYIELNLYATLPDGFVLDLRTSSELKPNCAPYEPSESPVVLAEWQRTYYSLDYRPDQKHSVFRLCFTAGQGRHVHMLPDLEEHIEIWKVQPNTYDLDPRVFVQWVSEYRKSGTYPLTRVKP